MKKSLSYCLLLLLYLNTQSQSFKLDTLLYNGDKDNRVDFVILGDGYLESQLPLFLDNAITFKDRLIATEPFKTYLNYFNVFSIAVPSNEQGAADIPQNLIDNYYGSTFNFSGIERLLVPTRNDRITRVMANTFPEYDHVIMLVNTSKYGGSGGSIATASTHSESAEIAIHELGHSYAGLADEYWAGTRFSRELPNMTQQSVPTLVKWKNWLGDEGIDIIPFVENPLWHKPHGDCKMQVLGRPFCAVCREQFISVTQGLVSVIDEYEPKSDISLTNELKFTVDLVKPSPNTLSTKWYLNNQILSSNTDTLVIQKQDLGGGSNELIVQVYDSTSLDRNNSIYITTLTWQINSQTKPLLTKAKKDRTQKDVILSVGKTNIAHAQINVYPNPSHEFISLDYTLSQISDVLLTIADDKGVIVEEIALLNQPPTKNTHVLRTEKYTSGIYYVNFKTNGIYQTIRFIVN